MNKTLNKIINELERHILKNKTNDKGLTIGLQTAIKIVKKHIEKQRT